MRGERVLFGLAFVGVVIGLAGLLVGEGIHGFEILVPVGGGFALGSVAFMTFLIAKLPPAEEETAGH
jgi:hypothetical protein